MALTTFPRRTKRLGRASRRSLTLSLVAALALTGLTVIAAPVASAADPADVAPDGLASASASQNDGDGNYPAANLIDGDSTTRWASGNGPNADVPFTAWAQVDLGAPTAVNTVVLEWEAAYATAYTVQVASANPDTPASWTTVGTETAGNGGTDLVAAGDVSARYVRVNMLERRSTWDWGTNRYGYSLFSLGVLGTSSVTLAGFSSLSQAVPAGDDATVQVRLGRASATPVSVHLTSSGGTAAPGTDYTAVDQVVTVPAGQRTADVAVHTVDHGPLAPVRTIELTLADPTNAAIGMRGTSVITLNPHGQLGGVGNTRSLLDFQGSTVAPVSAWGSAAASTPVLSLVDGADVPGATATNKVLQAVVAGMPAGGWGGFTDDIDPAEDWSGFDGFTFSFLGTGGGKTLRYELKSGGTSAGNADLFEVGVLDDTAGWRTVSVAFADLRLKGNTSSTKRFDPATAHGFAVTLSDVGAGTWKFDNFAVYQQSLKIQDFEGEVPLAAPGSTVGFFSWFSDGSVIPVGVTPVPKEGNETNKALSGSYLIPSGGFGGFSHNLAAPQDWSGFRGIRFLWYASQPNRPASPTAGDDIKFEVKDGGPNGEASELWTYTFKDNWDAGGSRWKLVEIPFTDFTLRTDFQAGSGATLDGKLSLSSAWGYAFTFPAGKSEAVNWAIDDVELFGTPKAAATVTVSAAQEVTLVKGGDPATVAVALKTTDGAPLADPVTVNWTTTDKTALAGTDYTAANGTLTFPAGTVSGATQPITVTTTARTGAVKARTFGIALTSTAATVGPLAPRVALNAQNMPYLDPTLPVAQRVADLMGRMTLAEKAGQMTQAERLGIGATNTDISRLYLGSLLSGGGSVPADNTPAGWANMVDTYQREALTTELQIPLIYGVDAVHGHNNVVGATLLPHNIGLGSTRDPAVVEAGQQVTAQEVRATGIPWDFAPCLCVTRDERWGRSYESFGEDPALVSAFSAASVYGLQGHDPTDMSGPDKILATIKHWAGDGGTRYEPSLAGSGYPIDQGVTYADSLAAFEALHVSPYLPAIAAGAGSLMPSYSAVDLGAGPVRMHENAALNNDLLKGTLGFKGFLISDWEGIDKLPGGTYAQKAVRSVNAGLDMAMAPYNYEAFINAVMAANGANTITTARIDDAVKRILTQKFDLGLFEKPFADRTNVDKVGSAAHRAVARKAAAESQVLLKNSDAVLPLAPNAKIYLAGSNADDLGHQMGGWSISWQGGSGNTTTGTTIRAGIAEVAPDATVTYSKDASTPIGNADIGVVVVGEPPYAEGQGDVGNNGRSLTLPAADRTAIDKVCAAVPCVVLVVSGRPQLVTDQLGAIDGLVASWLPGTEGGGVADTLFGVKPFTGRLPVSWPTSAAQVPINVGDATYSPLFPFGWGLRTDSAFARLTDVRAKLSAAGAGPAVLGPIDTALAAANFDATGAVVNAAAVIKALQLAGNAVSAAGNLPYTAADRLTSVVRDLVENQITRAGTTGGAPNFPTFTAAMDATSAKTAAADQAQAAGDSGQAITLLTQAWVALGNSLGQSDIVTTTTLSTNAGATTVTTAKITLTATVTAGADKVPTGTVTFTDGGTVLGTAAVSGGVAKLTIPTDSKGTLKAGSLRLKAAYVAGGGYTASTSAAVVVKVYFADLKAGSTFAEDAVVLAAKGVINGFSDGTFRPNALVDRQTAVTFLYRVAPTGHNGSVCGQTGHFLDVKPTDTFCAEIEWAAAQGITTGYPDHTFRRGLPVSREATAAFLYRLEHPGAAKPTCTSAPFVDVKVGSAFCGEIAWLKDEGISTGWVAKNGTATFDPGAPVSRLAFAAFLNRYTQD
ncbi:glycoside hydrolase family 3 [Nakamurella silvestris]|nr:glycoside hydrolase family 3 [Nakamurella silvestris]